MRSDEMRKGIKIAPHRSLLKALGHIDEQMHRPVIGICSAQNTIIPGHMNLDQVVQSVKEGKNMYMVIF